MDAQFFTLVISISVLFSVFAFISISIYRKEKKENNKMNEELMWKVNQSIYDLRDGMEKLKNEVYSSISDSRKYVEDKIYSDSKYFTQDSSTFMDSNKILLDTNEPGELLVHEKMPDYSFFKEMAIDLDKIKINEKMIVCLMPFNDKFDPIKYAITEACQLRGYTFRRSDDVLIKNNNDLRKSIIQMILEARIIVAVLDGRNPNVYYEMGLAHSMGKLVLMVVNMNEKPPFDVTPNRLITYKTYSELKIKLVDKFDAIRFEQEL